MFFEILCFAVKQRAGLRPRFASSKLFSGHAPAFQNSLVFRLSRRHLRLDGAL